jgi:hypothetical protein
LIRGPVLGAFKGDERPSQSEAKDDDGDDRPNNGPSGYGGFFGRLRQEQFGFLSTMRARHGHTDVFGLELQGTGTMLTLAL